MTNETNNPTHREVTRATARTIGLGMLEASMLAMVCHYGATHRTALGAHDSVPQYAQILRNLRARRFVAVNAGVVYPTTLGRAAYDRLPLAW